ncbi:hypothetical protein F5883DRAFT_616861 [Diaporthe sp. PMI_573]|nr:hypothetical protein F5883DRAFT_616861 [Diaporthaceae sp. PMI_573]
MGFFQVGVQVTRLAKDPDNPNKEPVPPPLFRPGTLLFSPDSDMANHNKDTMASNVNATHDADAKGPGNKLNTNTASISAGTWNAHIGTAFCSDPFVRYQMLTGALIGMCGVSAVSIMHHTPSPSILCTATSWIAIMAGATLLAKPKDERRM